MNKKPHANLSVEKNPRTRTKKTWYIETALILSTVFLFLSCDPERERKEEKVACPATSSPTPTSRAELLNLIDPRIRADANADLTDIDTCKITDMNTLFLSKDTFNGDISSWNTANVKDMSSMFDGAKAFNGNISNWNTGAVTEMGSMFWDATSFNRDISNWNTGAVTEMSGMFKGAKIFNQNLSRWNVSQVKYHTNVFDGSAMVNDTDKHPKWK